MAIAVVSCSCVCCCYCGCCVCCCFCCFFLWWLFLLLLLLLIAVAFVVVTRMGCVLLDMRYVRSDEGSMRLVESAWVYRGFAVAVVGPRRFLVSWGQPGGDLSRGTVMVNHVWGYRPCYADECHATPVEMSLGVWDLLHVLLHFALLQLTRSSLRQCGLGCHNKDGCCIYACTFGP